MKTIKEKDFSVIKVVEYSDLMSATMTGEIERRSIQQAGRMLADLAAKEAVDMYWDENKEEISKLVYEKLKDKKFVNNMIINQIEEIITERIRFRLDDDYRDNWED